MEPIQEITARPVVRQPCQTPGCSGSFVQIKLRPRKFCAACRAAHKRAALNAKRKLQKAA